MSTLMEEGELPEEGEITEDEEEQTSQNPESSNMDFEKYAEKKDLNNLSSKKNFALVSTGVSAPSAKTSKYRDYDGKTTHHSNKSQSIMMSSWISGSSQSQTQQRQSRLTTGDGNRRESGDGSAGNSPKSSATHKPGRSTELMDQDFRRMPAAPGGSTSFAGERTTDEEEPLRVENDGDEDNDYRQMSFGAEQKRRHTADDGAPFATKRIKPSALIDPFGPSTAAGDVEDGTAAADDSSVYDDAINTTSGSFYRRGQRPPAPHWASHTICKFFREGYCRDGENCAFSHNAADSNRRTELCKFYVQGFCKRGMNCTHLHGEFPCKSFHRGVCTNESCPFSHRPLDDFTRPIFEQALHDEEAASNVSLPSHPQKRKVLLPQGPETAEGEPTDESPPPADTTIVTSTTANTTASLTTPSRQQSMTIQQIKQRAAEDKALAAAGTFGFFNPVTPTTKPLATTGGTPIIPPPTFIAPPVITTTAATSTELKPPPPLTLGAFAAPLASSNGRMHIGSGHHGGFYNTPPARVANMPPPALLTVPPPLATTTTAAAAAAPTMVVPPSPVPAIVASSTGGFFNQPPVVAPPSMASTSTSYQPTQPPPLFGQVVSNTTAASTSTSPSLPPPSLMTGVGGFFGTPSSSSAGATAPPTSAPAPVDEPLPEVKPLAGMFSGGFFGNSSSSKKEKSDTATNGSMTMGGSDSSGFNISAMLEKITQQATASSAAMSTLPSLNSLIASTANKWEDESPASPTTNEPTSTSLSASVKIIPIVREWKLYRVDLSKENEDEINIDLKWIGQISSGSYKNDPRLKKLAEKQFDLVTKTLEKQSNSAAAAAVAKPSDLSQPSSSSDGLSGNAKKTTPVDPRVKSLTDPRKRSVLLPSQPSQPARPQDAGLAGLYSDFFNTSFPGASALPPPTAAVRQPGGSPPELSTANKLPDDIFQSMVQQQLKLVNQMQQQQTNNSSNSVDQRSSFPPPPIGQKVGFPPHNPIDPKTATDDSSFINTGFGSQGGYNESFGSQRFGGRPSGGDRNGGGRRGGGFQGKSRSAEATGPNGQRWNQSQESGSSFGNRGFPKKNTPNSGQSPSQPAAESAAPPPTAPQQPISLREKRKNNEYESPLARMSLSRY